LNSILKIHMEGTPPHVHRSSRHRFIHVLLFTEVIYLRVNHVGPIMDEKVACVEILKLEELKRIADTLERLLKISEMRP